MIRKQRNAILQSVRLEQLESRVLLAGHSFAAASSFHAAPVAAISSQSYPSLRGFAHSEATEHTALSATLSDSTTGAAATVNYKTATVNGTTQTELKVSVTGMTASSAVDVTLDGVVVGQVTTDANGAGTLVLSSNPKNATQQALPADFPTGVATGDKISVGTLAGTLATATNPTCGPAQAQRPQITTALTTTLADASNATVTGSVTYKAGTLNSAAFTELKVKFTGAAANSTLDVTVDGVVVGQVTTDANGAGTLTLSSNPKDSSEQPLPANFPTTIAAGAAVSVGTASGSLATATRPEGGCHGGTGESGSTTSTASQRSTTTVASNKSTTSTSVSKSSTPAVIFRPVRRG